MMLVFISLLITPIALGVNIAQSRLESDCVAQSWMQQSTNLFPTQFQILGNPSFNKDGKVEVSLSAVITMVHSSEHFPA